MPLFSFRLRCRALLLACACIAAAPAHAASATAGPLRPGLDDYSHARWGAEQGAPAAVRSMAQTSDGWLWLGTLDGLYRFDGSQFSRYPLPRESGMNRDQIVLLVPGPRGELYIVHVAEGVSVLTPDGRVTRLPALPGPVSGVDALTVDGDGSIWVVSKGVYQLRGGRWHTIETGIAWSERDARSFVRDGHGALWLTSEKATWRLDRARGRFARVEDTGGDLLTAPNGRLWLLQTGGTMRALGAGVASSGPAPVPLALASAQFAPDGSVWSLDCPERPCMLPAPAAGDGAGYDLRTVPRTAIAQKVQLSGSNPQLVLADREGNIWISSENGLDRFQRKRFSNTGLAGAGTAFSLAADANGRMWAAQRASGALWQLRPDGALPVNARHPVTVLSTTPGGELLLGGKRNIWRLDPATPELSLPPGADGAPADMHMLGILDDGVMLWTATVETGLLGWRDGRWHAPAGLGLPEKIYQSARAGAGRMWLATGDGELYLYDTANKRSGAPVDIRALGFVAAILPGSSELVVSGAHGSGVVRDGKLIMLRSADPDALRNVSGLVVTANGDRWLNGAAGLVHVAAAEWQRAMLEPAQPLRMQVFGAADGYPGRAVIETRWPSAWSADGRNLWLVATGGVVRFDTGEPARNRVAPTPVILAVKSDQGAQLPGPSRAALRLVPGTGRFDIEYTAPALRSPERVHFEYLLEGVDQGWQDAGARRSTSYTQVAPGDYVFRLRARNEDGVPSAADATLAITVEPMPWQTLWFKLLAAALAALLLVAAYRYRVRYLTRRLAERIHVQTAERERIARTLHDTFLQTVQSLLLRVDAVAASMPADAAARRQLDGILAHASSALGEGRAQLHELRVEGGDGLEQLLQDALAQLQLLNGKLQLGLRSVGARRLLRPEVVSEAAAIAREALHNACRHGGADQVRANLAYAADALSLGIVDNGRGFDEATLAGAAAPGHWGLVGMRERAERIGARLDFANGAEGGAIVTLTVPAARAYAAQGAADDESTG